MPHGPAEAEWLTRKQRIDTRLRSLNPAWQIIPWREGPECSQLTRHVVTEFPTAKARGHVEQFTPSLLAGAWTHSLPARSGCALSLRESLFTRSQRIQIAGQLVPQDPTDEPAEKLLERIKLDRPQIASNSRPEKRSRVAQGDSTPR